MKTKSLLKILFILSSSFVMASCAYGSAAADPRTDAEIGGYEPSAPSGDYEGEYPGVPDTIPGTIIGDKDEGEGDGNNQYIRPKTLTAGSYDDNEHYDFWKNLSVKGQDGEAYFSDYKGTFAFNTFNRVHLQLPRMLHANVALIEDGEVTYSTYSSRDGSVNLFAKKQHEQYEIEVTYKDYENKKIRETYLVKDNDILQLNSTEDAKDEIEIMFVVDTTGSMGDEIEFLKVEIQNVIEKVATKNENTKILTSVLAYKDFGDTYVTKYSDFTTDINRTTAFIGQLSADGGGDFEEAVHVALNEAVAKQWSGTSSTKLIFHVADAPSHDKDVTTRNKAVMSAAEQGIHICTVASSGIDTKTEYLMRSQSMLTNAKYLYLTDDSGIGGTHHINKFEVTPVVEYLNSLLVRTIDGFHKGEFAEPIYYQNDN